MKVVTMCCTTCPSGCKLLVTIDGNQVIEVMGNTCKRGEQFAHDEWTNPVRVLTSTVLAEINDKPVLIPVKTKAPIPKAKVDEAMDVIRSIHLTGPVTVGDVLVDDIAGTGAELVACRTIS